MHSTLFKLLPVAFAVAILSACGGSDSPPATPGAPEVPPPPPVPFASPAMIVPPGAESTTIALRACNNGLVTATLVVNASGDMILNGATNTTGPITELNRINYATASSQQVAASNSSSGPSVYVFQENAGGYLRAYSSTSDYFDSSKSTAPSHSYSCSLTNGSASFALTTLPSSARLASQMLSGITGITTTGVVTGSFTGGVAYWDNWNSGRIDNPATTDESIRYLSLNMSTGAFGTSPTPNTAGTSYVVTLPTTPTSTYAFFSETNANGTKSFSAYADNPTTGGVSICVSRVGNLFKPFDSNYCD